MKASTPASGPTGPLTDLVIVDCTMALAGPYGSAILADLGADVIKVEPPTGDIARPSPPLPEHYARLETNDSASADSTGAADSTDSTVEECSDYGAYFGSINRNKRSIALDLKKESDRETFLQLCEKADAVLENTRSGVMDRLGVGYEVVHERNPKIVYAALRGFGDPRTGESPYSDWPAFDIVAQAMGGFAHINGPPGAAGYPGGASVGDLFPGALLALGVVAAVHHARRTGQGQFMDIGMVDGVHFLCENMIANYGSAKKRELGPRGEHHPSLSPFGIYKAKDGGVAIAAPLPAQWKILCAAMGRPDLVTDERTARAGARLRNRDFVEEVISTWASSSTRQEIIDALGGQVPCGPVQTAKDIFASPHTEARGMLAEVEVPGDNPPVTIVANPIKYTATPTQVRHRAPLLDEHRREILDQFDLNDPLHAKAEDRTE